MIRFILHSILILVVTQLSNVAMGLLMSEPQQHMVTYQLTRLHDSITKSQEGDYSGPYAIPLVPTPITRMVKSELPIRIRVMLEGVFNYNKESLITNPETECPLAYDVPASPSKRYFHELCLLLI